MDFTSDILFNIGVIILLGIGAQWLAWLLKFPSIIFLLIFGFLSGPVFGFIDPDALLGDILLPFVSISVALILFEGGLTLNLKELKDIGRVVISLILLGVIITWIIGTVGAYYIIGLNFQISVLLGAILVVTGPTVIGPLVREIQPYGKIADILKWEGIVIDPIGALLAVLVFEAVVTEELFHAGQVVLLNLGKTIFFGFTIGYVFARLLILFLKRFWVPDYLQETVTLAMVIVAYIISDYFQHESGLFATTLMGIVMANQKSVNVRHILEFKENLRILIISILFIILSARIDMDVFNLISVSSLLFLAVLIFIGRPLSVFLATIRSKLDLKEKIFLSWMAPRGIVAAAVSSIFALRLSDTDIPQTEFLIPLTFIIIVGTVGIYGLTAPPLSKWLKVAQANPQGLLIVGAHEWALEIAKVIKAAGFRAVLIDTNYGYISKARMDDIDAVYGSVLSEHILGEINLDGLGKMVALTPNDEVNSLATLHYNEVFSKEELYQLPPRGPLKYDTEKASPKHLRGRFLFDEKYDFYTLSRKYYAGAGIKSTKLTDKFDYNAFRKYYGEEVIPMFIITENRKIKVITTDEYDEPRPGHTIIAMLSEPEEKPEGNNNNQ